MKISKYSVLMSVYRKENPQYLKQAIESIQMQTLQTDDFVLICDGPLNTELNSVIDDKKKRNRGLFERRSIKEKCWFR